MRNWFTMVLVMLLSLNVFSQSLDDVIGKYHQAMGHDKLLQVKTIKMKAMLGTMGTTYAKVIYKMRPNLTRSDMPMMTDRATILWDGNQAYSQFNENPHKVLSKSAGAELIEDADFDGFLYNYKQKGHTVLYLGIDKVNGKDYHHISVEPKGYPQLKKIWLIDTETYLLYAKMVVKEMAAHKLITLEEVKEYMDVNGIKFPKEIVVSTNGSIQSKLKIVEVELDSPDVTAELFEVVK